MAELVPDSFLRGLTAAAIEPGLRQVLLFDVGFTVLETAVSLLQQLLSLTTSREVTVVHLTGPMQEDDLWGSYVPVSPVVGEEDRKTHAITWQDGWLTQNRNDDRWLLVVIPDLTRLSLASSRACITLMDAPVAYIERHKQSPPWQPRICWLAACDSNGVGKISHHLLDRFALRLTTPLLRTSSSTAKFFQWVQGAESVPPFASGVELPDGWREKVTANNQFPNVSPEAIQRVVAFSKDVVHSGTRRELALIRLSRTLVRLAGETIVMKHHIDEAANLIGLASPLSDGESGEKEPFEPEPEPESPTEMPKPITTPLPEATETAVPPKPSPVIDHGEPEPMPASPLPVDPYPEDNALVDRELFPFQLPLHRYRASAAERGVIVGDEPADSLQDLALVPTILEAALYQKVRLQFNPGSADGIIFSPTDLRRYRRGPQPEKLLLLLLDYTSLRDCQWQQELIPHLRWAYVNRASITIIQVGSSLAKDELRAQRVSARSLLTPRIAEALEQQPGRATPLAHGLEMAYQVIQQAQQHGRSLIHETRFVVITDGRGNVPLDVSIGGRLQIPVNREGIEDALHIAREFRKLKRTLPVLLDPQPAYHIELPAELADALGAVHEKIPLVEEAQLI